VNGVSIPVLDFTGTPSTPNRKVLTTGLIFVPGISKNGTACTAADYNGVDAAGKVVLIKRGACAFALKTTLAKTKGAVGVIIYNTADGELPGGSVGSGDLVPVGMISLTDGLGLVKRLQAGETLSVDFMVDAIGEYRQTWNVIAETKGGDPKNVIVVCTHCFFSGLC